MSFLGRIFERSKPATTPSWSLFRPLSSLKVGQAEQLAIPAVARCIELIAGDVSRVPCRVESQDARGWYEVDSVVTQLLDDGPNDLLSGAAWKALLVRDLLIYGSSLCVLNRTPDGRIVSVTPAAAGTWGYSWDLQKQDLRYQAFGSVFEPGDVFHFRRAERLQFEGVGVLSQMSSTFAMIAAQYASARKVFESALPKIKLEVDEPVSASGISKLQEAFRSTHGDASSWNTPVVVSGGMRVGQIDTRLDQQEWSNAMEFAVADTARAFSVPVTMIDSSSSPTPEDVAAYLEGCLRPLMAVVEAEVRMKALQPGERLRFRTDQLTRGTQSQQAAAARQLVDAGLATPNECRVALGMPVSDQEGMDTVYISKNYAAVEAGTSSVVSSVDADDDGSDASGDS